MLDSKAVGSILNPSDGQFHLYIRGDYEENLHIHSFYRIRKVFKTYAMALMYFNKNYPAGQIVPFEKLTSL